MRRLRESVSFICLLLELISSLAVLTQYRFTRLLIWKSLTNMNGYFMCFLMALACLALLFEQDSRQYWDGWSVFAELYFTWDPTN